ncbi:electron transfer flavoprotein subunit beta/FixA family protein [Anaerotalea alkaliphila]|uniref:Electron transfer flavoprotein small subunit n=1 Tax=Anaerotalea alkaliphila TaxID=2662126 RepID=A0A7X5KLN9_9FIRM|nr:electron transfer flavoprotein subunit beta/FixA family protein [Anaerotalea alkaliphila]NDL67036.1 electron transfer flavoprotein subunit beta/FixA family protein [Anaerotalea alkaliphila]
MKIIVCIKQVPDSSDVAIDPESGTLIRMGQNAKTNPYDLYAIETALRIRDEVGGTVTALTMGPPQAEEMMRDAYMMGVDETVVMSDRKFAGSDVLATSYTLSQGIKMLEGADLIICGKQTTDGDTAQIGPAIAEHLDIPHVAWVKSLEEVNDRFIAVVHQMSGHVQVSEMPYPCLITVDKDIFVPRLPSYKTKLSTREKEVRFLSFADLPDKNLSRFGIIGSPTQVDKMFPPEAAEGQVHIEGNSVEKANRLVALLSEAKIL